MAGAVELTDTETLADILGGGFEADEVVSLTTVVGGATEILGSATADTGGAFIASGITILESMTAGVYTITAAGDAGSIGYGVVVITDKE